MANKLSIQTNESLNNDYIISNIIEKIKIYLISNNVKYGSIDHSILYSEINEETGELIVAAINFNLIYNTGVEDLINKLKTIEKDFSKFSKYPINISSDKGITLHLYVEKFQKANLFNSHKNVKNYNL